MLRDFGMRIVRHFVVPVINDTWLHFLTALFEPEFLNCECAASAHNYKWSPQAFVCLGRL